MQPTIDIVTRHYTNTASSTVREHVEYHRENLVMDAVFDACEQLAVDPAPLHLLARLLPTSEGETLARKLADAYARLDWVLCGGVSVAHTETGTRLTVGVAGCVVHAETVADGWLVTGRRTCAA